MSDAAPARAGASKKTAAKRADPKADDETAEAEAEATPAIELDAKDRPAYAPDDPEYRAWGFRRLREPFPAHQIGMKPAGKIRENANYEDCRVCGRNHKPTNGGHVDYVGHAAIVSRLLEVDPEYEFKALAHDADGIPIVGSAGLWGQLTVLGVTREEFGSGGTMKATLSDTLKRCAMRFGCAIDLWAKEDLSGVGEDEHTDADQGATRRNRGGGRSDGGGYSGDENEPPPPPPAPPGYRSRADADLDYAALQKRVESLGEEESAEFAAWKASVSPPWPWPHAFVVSANKRLDAPAEAALAASLKVATDAPEPELCGEPEEGGDRLCALPAGHDPPHAYPKDEPKDYAEDDPERPL